MIKLSIYRGFIIFAGFIITILGTLMSHQDSLFSLELFFVFIILASIIESVTIPMSKGYLSFTFAFTLCGFFVFQNIWITVLAINIGGFISLLFFTKNPLNIVLFNVAMSSLSTVSGGLVYSLLGGTWNRIDSIYILAMILTTAIVNHLIISSYFYLQNKFGYKQMIKDIGWDLFSYFITVPIGIFMILLHEAWGFIGMQLALVPLIVCCHIFKAYKRTEKYNQQLNGLYKITSEMNSNLDYNSTLKNISNESSKLLSLDCFYIFLEQDNCLKLVYKKGQIEDFIKQGQIEVGQGITGTCAKQKQKVVVLDTSKDERAYSWNKKVIPHSMVAVPLLYKNQLIGVMTGVKNKKNAFDKNDIKLFELMACQASVALVNAKTFKQVEDMTIIDQLTKLYNYRYFEQRVDEEVKKAFAEGGNVSLMVIDLDDFKKINDVYGHLAGNETLVSLAQIFKKSVRKTDIVFRYGGDEFVIVFPDTKKEIAYALGEKIIENVKVADFIFGENKENITFSAGIAEFPTDAEDHLELMRKADRIMYLGSKEKGKNRITLYK